MLATKVTNCHYCDKPGSPRGMWFPGSASKPWVKYVCTQPGCVHTYESAVPGEEGKIVKGRPCWGVPVKELTVRSTTSG